MIFEWTHTDINTKNDLIDMLRLFKQQRPTIGAFDTETDGLHIILSRPFMFQWGWCHEGQGYTFAVDLEETPALARAAIMLWHKECAPTLLRNLAHNVKFDLHMTTNINIPYTTENVSDTQVFIRLAHDALSVKHGGPPLQLKEYASRYVSKEAKTHEHLLNVEKTEITKRYNVLLRQRLGKGWTLKRVDEFFKDKVRDVFDLDPEARAAYTQWHDHDLPVWLRDRVHGCVQSDDIPYNHLNRANIRRYAHMDIVWVLETYFKLMPVILARHNEVALAIEESVIFPLFEMERVGFYIDKPYLEESRLRTKAYIIRQRALLEQLAGQPVKVGQHELLHELLLTRYHIAADDTKKETLERLSADLKHDDPENPAILFIDTIQELRTMEKWYATYIVRFQNNLKNCDRLYTQIHQVGTVSGRVTSDFQQFPRSPIQTVDKEELFSPRKLVCVPPDTEYDQLVYIDYSQIELRLQAMYTILVGSPEPNLCRAYMPYNCQDTTGHVFDPHCRADILNWRGEWFLCEDTTKRWVAIDVHAATTRLAFNVEDDDETFHDLRYQGKRVNFAKNYGAKYNRIKQMFPRYTDEQIHRIDDAYYKAFPGVKAYHDYCYKLCQLQSHGTNLFGVRYYNVSGHNMINMLVQGSGAYLLKLKIREIYDYTKAHGIKSRFQMNIHDELSWEKHRTEGFDVFYAFQHILETWEDTLVPIVAEMEASTTTWAGKGKVKAA